MFQVAKRAGIAVLLAAAVAGIPPVAYARIPERPSPAVSTQAISTDLPQVRAVQGSTSGFGWADAGIGAAVTVALVSAGAAILSGRRRMLTGRHQHARHSTTT